jgi:carbohydrate-binding DOMON domain-containing protein
VTLRQQSLLGGIAVAVPVVGTSARRRFAHLAVDAPQVSQLTWHLRAASKRLR